MTQRLRHNRGYRNTEKLTRDDYRYLMKFIGTCIAMIAVLMLLAAVQGECATYYADPSGGNNANSGTIEEPLESFEAIINDGLLKSYNWDGTVKNSGGKIDATDADPDTIFLRVGGHGNVSYTELNGYYNNTWVVVKEYPGEVAYFEQLRAYNIRYWSFEEFDASTSYISSWPGYAAATLYFDDSGGQAISNLQFINLDVSSWNEIDEVSSSDVVGDSSGVGIQCKDVDSLLVQGCLIHDVIDGINVLRPEGFKLIGNTVYEHVNDGIQVSTFRHNDWGMEITDNLVYNLYRDTNGSPVEYHEDGIQIIPDISDPLYAYGLLIARNRFLAYTSDRTDDSVKDGQGIVSFNAIHKYWRIENNFVMTSNHGISFYDGIGDTLQNNTVIDINTEDAVYPTINIADSDSDYVANNVSTSSIGGSGYTNATLVNNLWNIDPDDHYTGWNTTTPAIRATSTAIDAGSNTYAPDEDLYETARDDGTVDQGAIEDDNGAPADTTFWTFGNGAMLETQAEIDVSVAANDTLSAQGEDVEIDSLSVPVDSLRIQGGGTGLADIRQRYTVPERTWPVGGGGGSGADTTIALSSMYYGRMYEEATWADARDADANEYDTATYWYIGNAQTGDPTYVYSVWRSFGRGLLPAGWTDLDSAFIGFYSLVDIGAENYFALEMPESYVVREDDEWDDYGHTDGSANTNDKLFTYTSDGTADGAWVEMTATTEGITYLQTQAGDTASFAFVSENDYENTAPSSATQYSMQIDIADSLVYIRLVQSDGGGDPDSSLAYVVLTGDPLNFTDLYIDGVLATAVADTNDIDQSGEYCLVSDTLWVYGDDHDALIEVAGWTAGVNFNNHTDVTFDGNGKVLLTSTAVAFDNIGANTTIRETIARTDSTGVAFDESVAVTLSYMTFIGDAGDTLDLRGKTVDHCLIVGYGVVLSDGATITYTAWTGGTLSGTGNEQVSTPTFNSAYQPQDLGGSSDGSYYGAVGYSVAEVTLSSPDGGESWYIGTEYGIVFEALEADNIEVLLSRDNGSTWAVIDTVSAVEDSLAWTVTAPASDSSLVCIRDLADTTVADTSAAIFSIINVISLTTPNGGEEYERGSSHNVAATATGGADYGVALLDYGVEVQRDTTSTFPLLITYPDTTGTDYTISVFSLDDSTRVHDQSDAVFSLVDELSAPATKRILHGVPVMLLEYGTPVPILSNGE